MNKEQLYKLLDNGNPTPSDVESLKQMSIKYPYFEAARFLYLKALYEHDILTFKTELPKQSVLISNRESLFYYIFRADYAKFLKSTGKEKIEESRTNFLLSAFFEGNESESSALEYEKGDTNLALVDYLSYLEEEKAQEQKKKREEANKSIESFIVLEEKTVNESQKQNVDSILHSEEYSLENLEAPEPNLMPLKHQNLIDNFIEKSKTKEFTLLLDKESLKDDKDYLDEDNSKGESQLGEDTFFTETLAKIYTKQGRFERAYEIIEHLSLKYPKKNSYFADQLSYLEKLIINSKHIK